MPVRMLKKDEDTKREKGLKKSKMLSGGQVKLDKNKDGKISGEDFKMMKRKRGGSTPGLKNYVKKSDSQGKLIKAINKKTGQTVFVSRKEILADGDSYRPVESGIKNKERLSESDKERAEKMMKRKRGNPTAKENNTKPPFSRFVFDSDNKGFSKGGGSAISKEKRKRELIKKQNPISEYGPKGKLKYTAANKGAMMSKSTRGYGAARTSGMGLQDEQVKPGKVQKAFLGVMAMKKAKKKGAKGAEFLSPALLAKRILGRKSGGPVGGISKLLGGSKNPKPGNMMNKERLAKLKQQLNRFKERSKKGGGADESKRMSDKTKQSIQNLVKRIGRGRLTPGVGSDAGKRLRKKRDDMIMTPLKKMGGGMTMKKYNKGGSVTASCKLGRNKATKLY